jgi:hypothetical protein
VALEEEATAKVVMARQMGEGGGCGGDRRLHGDRRARETKRSSAVSWGWAIGFLPGLSEQQTFLQGKLMRLLRVCH